jgi:hypothetical protein
MIPLPKSWVPKFLDYGPVTVAFLWQTIHVSKDSEWLESEILSTVISMTSNMKMILRLFHANHICAQARWRRTTWNFFPDQWWSINHEF